MENNVAVVQPTPHLKSKDLNIRKNIQKPAQSPTRGSNTESEYYSITICSYSEYIYTTYIYIYLFYSTLL